MRYLPQEVFVANTDRAWFDFLSVRAVGGRLDEVNFWLPKGTSPMPEMQRADHAKLTAMRVRHSLRGPYGRSRRSVMNAVRRMLARLALVFILAPAIGCTFATSPLEVRSPSVSGWPPCYVGQLCELTDGQGFWWTPAMHTAIGH